MADLCLTLSSEILVIKGRKGYSVLEGSKEDEKGTEKHSKGQIKSSQSTQIKNM